MWPFSAASGSADMDQPASEMARKWPDGTTQPAARQKGQSWLNIAEGWSELLALQGSCSASTAAGPAKGGPMLGSCCVMLGAAWCCCLQSLVLTGWGISCWLPRHRLASYSHQVRTALKSSWLQPIQCSRSWPGRKSSALRQPNQLCDCCRAAWGLCASPLLQAKPQLHGRGCKQLLL